MTRIDSIALDDKSGLKTEPLGSKAQFAANWSLIVAALSLVSIWLFTGSDKASAQIFYFSWSFIGFISYFWYFRGFKRYADLITISRFVLTLSLFQLFITDPTLTFTKFLFAGFILILDGVDGFVARRKGPTESGAIFDMETDGFYTLTLCTLGVLYAGSSPWLFMLAAMRPVYVLICRVVEFWYPIHGTDLRPTFRGKFICVAMLAILLANLFPPLASFDLTYINVSGGVFLVISFAIDFGRSLKFWDNQ